jgi:hypothetical protein
VRKLEMSHIVRLDTSAYECDWCERNAKWKKITKGHSEGMWGGGIYMRACDGHKDLLEEIKHRKGMGK